MSLSSNFPTSKPSLNLDFANVGALDPRITFTRSSSATYTNSLGLIATAATNVARFDYDPVTLAARGLLVEEQRTNLYTYSEQFDNAIWVKESGATISANSIVSPDGTSNADTLIGVSAGSSCYQVVNVNTGTAYTFSVFAKSVSGASTVVFQIGGGAFASQQEISFNASTGALIANADSLAYSVTAFGNGWYRYAITRTTTATSTHYADINCAGSLGLWGAQLEAGSFATSYIPTVASTVTRSADVASVNTLSPWFNATEGTLYVEYTIPFTSGNRYLVSFDKDSSNYIEIAGNTTGNNTVLYQRQGGTLDVSIQGASNVSTSGINKLAAGFATNNFAYYLNGVSQGTDTSNTLVSGLTSLEIGRYNEGAPGGYFGGCIRRIAYYPRRLTNAELQALTA